MNSLTITLAQTPAPAELCDAILDALREQGCEPRQCGIAYCEPYCNWHQSFARFCFRGADSGPYMSVDTHGPMYRLDPPDQVITAGVPITLTDATEHDAHEHRIARGMAAMGHARDRMLHTDPC